ncbi:pyridoxal-phosphate dependent enzyme [Robbsia sp. Bb-Pol-6]|uniref:L-serine ammonia-lyase n=1 Tax=Robbsia betulipollinis TaxID=2981849 RepID=A0ABT3ZMA0_9BURK|nr:pyridoxal-phosphate dependent enzyme [Robbsia betulipollinis]MCY0387405.1 pyridoxal-phosphate dependent enzyme [Robbsia betulipollinis]
MFPVRTPLLLHPFLSTPERRIWLKLENLQPSGSFKMRGLGALCADAKARGKTHIVAPSGGNAGYSAALAARALGMSAEVVVPTTTPPATRELIARTGATLTVHGDVWEESNQYALDLCAAAHVQYAPAFDHPVIWQGNSTMIDEIVADLPQMDVIVVSVGGGGLLAGALTGLARHDRLDCRVVACETQGAASFRAALDAGRPVRIDAITSMAKSLGALQVARWPVEAIRRFPHVSVVLPDSAALMGVVRFADDLRQLVEPACGVALATAYLDHPSLAGARDVVVVVCGGVSVSARQLLVWQQGEEARHSA